MGDPTSGEAENAKDVTQGLAEAQQRAARYAGDISFDIRAESSIRQTLCVARWSNRKSTFNCDRVLFSFWAKRDCDVFGMAPADRRIFFEIYAKEAAYNPFKGTYRWSTLSSVNASNFSEKYDPKRFGRLTREQLLYAMDEGYYLGWAVELEKRLRGTGAMGR